MTPAQVGREYDLWIAGAAHKTGDLLVSVNPSKPAEIVGRLELIDEIDGVDAALRAVGVNAEGRAAEHGQVIRQ